MKVILRVKGPDDFSSAARAAKFFLSKAKPEQKDMLVSYDENPVFFVRRNRASLTVLQIENGATVSD